MEKDKLLVAGIIGALSTIPAEIVTRILLVISIGKYSAYELDSLIFTHNRPTTIIGLIVCLVVGGFGAILLYLAFEKLGSNNIVIKSAMCGLLMCMLLQAFITIAIEGKFIDIRPINYYYIHMLASFTFGIVEGLLFKKFLFS